MLLAFILHRVCRRRMSITGMASFSLLKLPSTILHAADYLARCAANSTGRHSRRVAGSYHTHIHNPQYQFLHSEFAEAFTNRYDLY